MKWATNWECGKWSAVVALGILWMTSCKPDEEEVVIDTTRPLTTEDKEVRIGATPVERFLPPTRKSPSIDPPPSADASSWVYKLPAEDWKVAAARPFREVNLIFGEGETVGEVYLTTIGGDLKGNIDRWYRQFGEEPQPLDALSQVKVLGQSGYLVEAKGSYNPGMGRPPAEGKALLGLVAPNQGQLLTIKMIGPAEEVARRREEFLQFVASLQRS